MIAFRKHIKSFDFVIPSQYLSTKRNKTMLDTTAIKLLLMLSVSA